MLLTLYSMQSQEFHCCEELISLDEARPSLKGYLPLFLYSWTVVLVLVQVNLYHVPLLYFAFRQAPLLRRYRAKLVPLVCSYPGILCRAISFRYKALRDGLKLPPTVIFVVDSIQVFSDSWSLILCDVPEYLDANLVVNLLEQLLSWVPYLFVFIAQTVGDSFGEFFHVSFREKLLVW